MATEIVSPRCCGHCGAETPPNNPRFCIACGRELRPAAPADSLPELVPFPATTGPTVRLANAPGAQAVIGGTVKLPTSGAVPPGLWFVDEPPRATDVIAIYAPLRAIVGGWSGLEGLGWRKVEQAWTGDGTSRDLVRFEVEREWFAAPGRLPNARLCVRIAASSFADEGRTRRGFRYRVGADPPMEVVAVWWRHATTRQRLDWPVPDIQIMAPPRVCRVSDYDEPLREMNAREAHTWAMAGVVHGLFHLPNPAQQRTPVGRGLPLVDVTVSAALRRLVGQQQQLYRVRMHNPLIVGAHEWPTLHARIQAEAHELGLDMQTDAVAEWWLDRQGHDGALFEEWWSLFGMGRTAIAFRRAQIARIIEE